MLHQKNQLALALFYAALNLLMSPIFVSERTPHSNFVSNCYGEFHIDRATVTLDQVTLHYIK